MIQPTRPGHIRQRHSILLPEGALASNWALTRSRHILTFGLAMIAISLIASRCLSRTRTTRSISWVVLSSSPFPPTIAFRLATTLRLMAAVPGATVEFCQDLLETRQPQILASHLVLITRSTRLSYIISRERAALRSRLPPMAVRPLACLSPSLMIKQAMFSVTSHGLPLTRHEAGIVALFMLSGPTIITEIAAMETIVARSWPFRARPIAANHSHLCAWWREVHHSARTLPLVARLIQLSVMRRKA